MAEKLINLQFQIEGPFITMLARERFYQEHNLGGAIKLLMSCLETDQMSYEERFMLALKILNGNAEIVGTYPNDDYGVKEIKDKDEKFDIVSEIDAMSKQIKKLEKEAEENLQKFLFVLDDLPDYKLREINNNYESVYGEKLFPELQQAYSTDNLLAIDKFNKETPSVESYITHMNDYRDDDYGWLEPNGTYHVVPWGEHSQWAAEWLNEHYPFKDNADVYWYTDAKGERHHVVNGDCLIYKFNWVLLDSPYQGIAHPQYNPSHGLTKAQREFLYDYYIDRNMHDKANEFYEDYDD